MHCKMLTIFHAVIHWNSQDTVTTLLAEVGPDDASRADRQTFRRPVRELYYGRAEPETLP